MGCRARAVVTALLVCAGMVVGVPSGLTQPQVKVDGDVTALAFDAKGKWIAVGFSSGDGSGLVRLYSMKRRAGDHVDLPKMSKPISNVAFVGEDKYLAIADEGSEVVVWSWPEISEVFRANLAKQQGQPGSRFQVLGNPRGPHIAWIEVAPAGAKGKAEVVELPRGEVITSFDKVSIERQAAWSRDGGHLLLNGSVWNWDTLKSWRPAAPAVTALSDDGTRLASAPPDKCEGISLVDVASGKPDGTVETKQGGCPVFLWFIAGDKSLVWLSDDGTRGSILYRWDAKPNRVKAVKKGLPAAIIAALSSNGRLMAIADAGRVRFVTLR